ncbi:hypothetical protein ACNSOL_00045 [Aliarcobacter lanthieri]|uniref:hypothetical protein n=1 Tax=Aliarcobacter lanthieri TaxID=1355374 RepID=UPI003AAC9C92
MSKSSLIDVSKHQNKLRAIVALNVKGATVFTDKTAMALNVKSSRSEFIEAFKADIDKTATYLIDSLGIINSIKNGLIQELDTLDNSVENFFGKTYKDGVITLSGVDFVPGTTITKGQIVDSIYNKLFDINRKELNVLSKVLARYETATSDVEKALLYPSTVMADRLINQIGLIDHKFNEFRASLDFVTLQEFTSSFNRSGITDVIQNSTYVDSKGVRQLASSHKHNIPMLSEISESLKASKFKYVQALELDADSDVRKAFNVINQIERLEINIKEKFTLKFRKLGNYNAKGLCIDSLGIVAEDVRDSSALIHEIAHYIHLSNKQVFESKFVNYMIDKLVQRVDLNNLPDIVKVAIVKKEDYYTSRDEVIARALEIAALFANETSRVIWSDDDLDLIKSRSYYEENEGIYFNFNSFDDITKEEMLMLWELFYETSYNQVANTDIDLFVKIDTKFKRQEKNFSSLEKEAEKLSLKEQKELYSLVNMENIDLIINNKPKTLGIDSLSLLLFKNISIWASMSKRMSKDDWVNVLENQFAPIFLKLIEATKNSLDSKEYVEFLNTFKNSKSFYSVDNLLGLGGFKNLEFKVKLKAELLKSNNWAKFKELKDALVKYSALALANKEILEDLEYVKKFYFLNHKEALRLDESGLFSEDVYMKIYRYLYDSEKTAFIPINILKIITLEEKIEINNYMIANRSEIELLVDGLKEKYKDQLGTEKSVEPETKTLTNKTLGKKIEEIKNLQKQEFEDLIKQSEIVDFEHTKTGEQLKVLKVKEKIANFKAFNEYLINNGIAYYSKFAQGFIIKNLERVQVASAIGLAIYSQDLLETFANGSLF